jgi:hypothetical protein
LKDQDFKESITGRTKQEEGRKEERRIVEDTRFNEIPTLL